MGYSHQKYLIARDDTILRMANTAFDRMLQEPTTCRLPELAGRRVHTTEVVVGLVGREPAAIVHTSSTHRSPSLFLITRDALTPTGTASNHMRGLKLRWSLRLSTPTAMGRWLTQPASSLRKAAFGRPLLLWREPSLTSHLGIKGALVCGRAAFVRSEIDPKHMTRVDVTAWQDPILGARVAGQPAQGPGEEFKRGVDQAQR